MRTRIIAVAPGLGAPVFCHPAEQQAAASPDPTRPYFDFSKLAPHGRLLIPRLLPVWDGGPVTVAGTVSEGDQIAGFRVIELPGSRSGAARTIPGDDRVALVSDCVYTLDPQTGIKGPAASPTRRSTSTLTRLASPSAGLPGWSRRWPGPAMRERSRATWWRS